MIQISKPNSNEKPPKPHTFAPRITLLSIIQSFLMNRFCIAIVLLVVCSNLNGQIINVEDKRVRLKDSIAFKGYADIALNVYKNDKSFLAINASTQLEQVYLKHLFLLIGGYNLVKAGNSNFLNDGFGHFRYNYDVSKKVVFEAFTQAQYNQRTRSKFRGLVGTGLRFKFRLSDKQRFYLGTALMFEHNQFSDATPRQYDIRLSHYLSMNIAISDKVKFNNTTYIQPILTDLSNYRMASQANLMFQISKRLVFKVSANLVLDRDARLPPSVPDLIYAWTNGLRWEFGQ